MASSTLLHATRASRFRRARPDDDPELRRLLRENPLDGAVRVTLEREPSCFAAAAIEGDRHDFIVARDRRGQGIVGFGSRAIFEGYVNGVRQRLGYLSQLRVQRGTPAAHGVLRRGYRYLAHMDGHDGFAERCCVPLYVTTIVTDNQRARRFLERGLPGMPTYRPVAPFVTLLLPASRKPRKRRWNGTIVSGTAAFARHREGIAACLQRSARRFQFARHWRSSDLCSKATPGLRPADFCIGVRDGRVVGCIACWDQRALKQVVVRGYRRGLALVRPLYNLLAPVAGVPVLPRLGSALDHAYISHVAIDHDDPDCFLDLLEEARRRACALSAQVLAIGFARSHRLVPVVRRVHTHRAYESIVYVAHWEDGAEWADQLDDRVPHLEVATL